MDFEELQKAWQGQDAGAQVTIDADLLLREVRRNERQFWATIFWRDAREVGACALMTGGFLAWGVHWRWWSFYFLAFCCLGLGAFFVVDRRIQRRKQPVKNDSLQGCVANSLFQVNHQIWLLKNIFYWYLLPIVVGVSAVMGQTIWNHRTNGLADMITVGATFAVVYGVTFGAVYWVNQIAVRKDLEPRRNELEELLASLE